MMKTLMSDNDNISIVDYDINSINHKLPLKKKINNKEWVRANADYCIRHSSFNGTYFNTQDLVNKNVAKGIMDKTDFEYITNPSGLKDKSLPAELLEFNIVKGKKKVLTGEERKRPFNFMVTASNEDTVSEMDSMLKDIVLDNFESAIVNMLGRDGVIEQKVDKLTGQPIVLDVKTSDEIEEYMNMTYKQQSETIAQRSLNYIQKFNHAEDLFNYGFDNYLDTNKEIYCVANIANEPILRKVDSTNFYVALNPNSPWVEDGERCVEMVLMRPSDIYDEYYEELGDNDEYIDRIESYRLKSNTTLLFNNSGTETGPNIVTVDQYDMTNTIGYEGLIPVFKCQFKSLRKVGLLTYIDEYGLKQEDVVDEEFKVIEPAIYNEDKVLVFGQEVEWCWINDLWQVDRIGNDIYLRGKPAKSHYSSIDNLSTCKLNYVGYFSNDPSLVHEMKPYQYFYWVLLYRLQLAFASDKGKIMLMDITQIPAEHGWNPDRWLYYLDAMKVAFINPFAEGKVKRGGKASSFNQFKEIDMTLGNQINSYIMALDKLDDMLASMTGITKARQGNIATSETVGGVERSVAQSSYITEYLFATHAEVKRRALSALLEISKECWKNGKKIHYFDDELGRVWYSIDGNKYSNFNYDIFTSDSSRDFNQLEALKAHTEKIINSNKGTLSDIIAIVSAKSITEVDNKIKKSERKIALREQQQASSEQQLEQQKQEKEDKRFYATLENTEKLKQLDVDSKEFIAISLNETNLEIAGIKVDDENNNNEPDIMETKTIELGLKREQMALDNRQFNIEQTNEMKRHNDNMKVKEKTNELKDKALKISSRKAKAK